MAYPIVPLALFIVARNTGGLNFEENGIKKLNNL